MSLLCAADEANWPRFRGPNGAGLAPDVALPVSIGPDAFAWKVALPGHGHGSPVVWGQRLFLIAADPQTARRTVLCLRAADGSVLWRRDFQSRPFRQHGDNSYAASTPAVDERHVYVCWATPDEYTLLALDHDGNQVWRITAGDYPSQHGAGGSPMLAGELVILANDNEGPRSFILAVDRMTGQTRWQLPRTSENAAASTPCLYVPDAQSPPQLIVTSRTEGIVAIDPSTGQAIWRVADAFVARVVASPVIADGLVVSTCGEGGAGRGMIAVRPGSASRPPQVLWRRVQSVPYVPTVLARGELLFLLSDNGAVECIRAAGGQSLWRSRLPSTFYGSPVCVGDRIYAVSRNGQVFVFRAAEQFELLGQGELGEGSFATPAVAGGRMYFRTFTHLICVGAAE